MTKQTFSQMCAVLCFLFGIDTVAVHAVSLKNWRQPFYTIAAQQSQVSSSPSGLFWDDLTICSLLDTALWPDSIGQSGCTWSIEPSVVEQFSSQKFITGKPFNYSLNGFSQFTYGRFLTRTALAVDQRYKEPSSDFPWKKDRALAGRLDEAYCQFTSDHGFIRLGRLYRNWGPFIDRSIFLSDNPFSYDGIEWQFRTPFLEFRHLITAFMPASTIVDNNGGFPNIYRFFSAHALNFIIGQWASLGIFESILFARNHSTPDWVLINPFTLYVVENTNSAYPAASAGNCMIGIHGWIHPGTPKITLKGQVIIDDIQVDNKTIGDQEPTHWAYDIGFYWYDCLPLRLMHNISIEYRYLSKWLYTVTNYGTRMGERYTYLGRSLGYPQPDGDDFRIAFTAVGSNFWTAGAGIHVIRQDTNTIKTLWNSDLTLGYRKEAPLSQRAHLKTTASIDFTLNGYYRDCAALTLQWENRMIKDKRLHRHYHYDPFFSLQLSVHRGFYKRFL